MNFNIDIKRAQLRLLEMGKGIARSLDAHNIPYMITFGTLLGAVRHGGFIPWDDDFDMFLFDDTYDEALCILRKELPNDMFVEYSDNEKKYFHSWAHIKDTNSITSCKQYPHDNLYEHKGLSIDLYKAVKMQGEQLDDFLFSEHENYLSRRYKHGALSLQDYNEKKKDLDIKHKDSSTAKEYGLENKTIFGMSLAESFMLYESVMPLKKYRFADTEFWGPADYDEILTHFYGNYMELPKEENRVPHYDSIKFI